MSKSISLKLEEKLFEQTDKYAKKLGISRSRYVADALVAYNRQMERDELAKQLKRASELVRESSMEVLKEFEALEDEIPE
jgi:metal-responsive CopG/Arc/MetJ family transcriptional regulator